MVNTLRTPGVALVLLVGLLGTLSGCGRRSGLLEVNLLDLHGQPSQAVLYTYYHPSPIGKGYQDWSVAPRKTSGGWAFHRAADLREIGDHWRRVTEELGQPRAYGAPLALAPLTIALIEPPTFERTVHSDYVTATYWLVKSNTRLVFFTPDLPEALIATGIVVFDDSRATYTYEPLPERPTVGSLLMGPLLRGPEGEEG